MTSLLKRIGTVLKGRGDIIRYAKSCGFKERSGDRMDPPIDKEDLHKKGWNIFEMIRKNKGTIPDIRMRVLRHKIYGTSFCSYTIPSDSLYEFETGCPRTESESISLFLDYMERINFIDGER